MTVFGGGNEQRAQLKQLRKLQNDITKRMTSAKIELQEQEWLVVAGKKLTTLISLVETHAASGFHSPAFASVVSE